MQYQPGIANLGNTESHSFPLILIFGREYNNIYEVKPILGQYSFADSPRSTFWNRAYTFVDRNSGKALGFKKTCIELDLSPILFSNVLPKPILSELSSNEKRKIRTSISKDIIDEYVKGIFRLPIIRRVKLVVLSGVDDESIFGYATSLIRNECEGRSIVVETLPYFGSRSSNSVIDDALAESAYALIIKTINEFHTSSLGKDI